MQLLNILLLCLTTAIVMHSSHNVRGTVNAAMSMKVRYPDKDGKAALPKGGPHRRSLPPMVEFLAHLLQPCLWR